MRHRTGLAGFARFAQLLSVGAFAEAPTLTHLYPVAGQAGRPIAVAFAGKFEPWPPQVWVDAPGIAFTATPVTGTFNVDLAADAPPGPHLVRVFDEQGASAPRVFIVAREPQLREAEPNDAHTSPQALAELPATINGRLDKSGDVDSFAVTLRAGQTVVVWLEAYVLGSAFDGLIRIVDETGRQLAFNHDGRLLDPFLAWEAPRDGRFIVQVMGFAFPPASDVRLTGGEGCVYRLHLTGGAFVRHTLPLAAPRGSKGKLQLIGWNLPSPELEFEAAKDGAVAALPGVMMAAPVALSDIPELIEAEPNDVPAAAQQITVPGAVTGRIQQPKDEDRYTFTAKKQQIYELKITGDPCGSALDAWMQIDGADGKELARNDDADKSPDPQLSWTAPADGPVTVTIGDVAHRGGAAFVYRFAFREAAPRIEATVAAHAFTIAPGKTSDIKVTIKRLHGHATKLQLTAADLPAGITAPPVEFPEKGEEATLKLTADAAATAANQPFKLLLQEVGSDRRFPVRYPAKGTDENYTEALIDWTDALWLSVIPEPPK